MPEHQQIQQSKKPNTSFQKQATPIIQTPLSNPYSIIQRAKINPKSLTHADVMQLQRTIGNRAVDRLLSSIGSSSTAQQATVQRQEIPEDEGEETCPSCMQRQENPEEEPLQGKMIETVQRQETLEEEKPLQGKMIGTIQRQEIPEEKELLQTKKENNTGMPDNLKAGVESLSGIDMSDVRVHYNSSKPADVGALAYTQGTNIHVAPGQERHLPHEAWHVVQQAQGRVKPTMQLKYGVPVNDDEGLEHEADVMGAKVTANAVQLKGMQEEQELLHGKFAPVQHTRPGRVELQMKKFLPVATHSDPANAFYHPKNLDDGGESASLLVQLRASAGKRVTKYPPAQLMRQIPVPLVVQREEVKDEDLVNPKKTWKKSQFKEFYELKDGRILSIRNDKDNTLTVQEFEALNKIAESGLRTPNAELVEYKNQKAIRMLKVEGTFVDFNKVENTNILHVLLANILNGKQTDMSEFGISKLLTETPSKSPPKATKKLVSELGNLLRASKTVVINDLQAIVDKDGNLTVIDPQWAGKQEDLGVDSKMVEAAYMRVYDLYMRFGGDRKELQ